MNALNNRINETNKTLSDTKANFMTFIELCRKLISYKSCNLFHKAKICEVTVVLAVVNHLKILASDLKERFSDLKEFHFPTSVKQPLLVDLSGVSIQYHEVLSEMQNDESVKILFNVK